MKLRQRKEHLTVKSIVELGSAKRKVAINVPRVEPGFASFTEEEGAARTRTAKKERAICFSVLPMAGENAVMWRDVRRAPSAVVSRARPMAAVDAANSAGVPRVLSPPRTSASVMAEGVNVLCRIAAKPPVVDRCFV